MAHAVADFAISLPDRFREWHANSQYIVSLATATAADLARLKDELHFEGYELIGFCEPDLDDQLTAFALAPNGSLKKRLSQLPLAGKKGAMA